MTAAVVSDYPWAALDTVALAAVQQGALVRRLVERAVRLDSLAAAVGETLAAEVKIIRQRIDVLNAPQRRSGARVDLELSDGSATVALDLEPRGATFRLLDFKILKVLDIGWGDDYHSFSVVEMPDLLNVLTTRHEGPVSEHRFVDLQALALAAMRLVKKSEREAETQVLKIPLLGSLYGHEIDGATEEHTVLYLYRRENER